MKHPNALSRARSSTLALGVASGFILATVTLGLVFDQATRATSGTATWQLRGTFAPEGAKSWQGPRFA